jgi:hypothetical protein
LVGEKRLPVEFKATVTLRKRKITPSHRRRNQEVKERWGMNCGHDNGTCHCKCEAELKAVREERDNLADLVWKMTKRINELEQEASRYKEALIWCSGSEDFSYPNGKARKGWERIVKPLLAAPSGGAEKENRG